MWENPRSFSEPSRVSHVSCAVLRCAATVHTTTGRLPAFRLVSAESTKSTIESDRKGAFCYPTNARAALVGKGTLLTHPLTRCSPGRSCPLHRPISVVVVVVPLCNTSRQSESRWMCSRGDLWLLPQTARPKGASCGQRAVCSRQGTGSRDRFEDVSPFIALYTEKKKPGLPDSRRSRTEIA